MALKNFFSKFKKEKGNDQEKEKESVQENIQETTEITEPEPEEHFEIEIENSEITVQEETQQNIEGIQDLNDSEEEKPEETKSFFSRLKQGLSKTREGITARVEQVLKTYRKVDESLFEEIEEILITSDAGVETTMKIIDTLREVAKEKKITEAQDLKAELKKIIAEELTLDVSYDLNIEPSPAIILVVGVNGVGKTTSIGKIAYQLKNKGKKVMLAAGDTFRAAAIEQLEIWGNRVGVDVVRHQEGSDPAAVIYDAIQSAKAKKIDVLICDTAGRLHNKKNLMNELGKVKKVVEREFPEATKEVLLVLDATTGQNAIQQAKTFKEVTDISGIVLTKLDGTAKGGIVLTISAELGIPVKLIGVGEKMDDLQKFSPSDFVEALFEE